MHRERLNKLADLLENYREDSGAEFTLSCWNKRTQVIKGHLWWRTYHWCHTAGCAVGHAMEDKWFQDQGLRALGIQSREPHYNGESQMEAVAAFFEIAMPSATHLFTELAYGGGSNTDGEAGAKLVAARIREFTRMLPEELTKLQHSTEKLEELLELEPV